MNLFILNLKPETLNLKLLFSLLLIFMLSGCSTLVRYREIKPPVIEGKEEKIEIEEPVPSLRLGEKLTYQVSWIGIPVGIATTQVKDIVDINGRQYYHLIGTAHSNKWLNMIFRVDDYIESYLDKETLLSLKHIAKRKEGRYRTHMILDYDWQNRSLNFQNLTDGTKGVFPLPWDAVDEFSAFYYFRLQEIPQDKPLVFIVNQVDKNWRIEIEVASFGVMNLPTVGVFDAFMVEPAPRLNEKALEQGKAWIWFSNDERRIPLMIKLHVNIPFLGTVVAILQNIE